MKYSEWLVKVAYGETDTQGRIKPRLTSTETPGAAAAEAPSAPAAPGAKVDTNTINAARKAKPAIKPPVNSMAAKPTAKAAAKAFAKKPVKKGK